MDKVESYEMQVVNRSSFHMADYNPRLISQEARKRLKESVKQFHFVQPPIVNKRTQTVVSGHQRLSIMDELQGYPKNDYQLEVAFIDVSEKEEKQLNILLNNVSSMGEFDIGSLSDLVLDNDLDLNALGFSDADLDVMFSNDSRFLEMFEDTPEMTYEKETLDDIKKDRKETAEKQKEENSANFYFTVICGSADEKEKLLRQIGVAVYEDFVPASRLYGLVDADLSDLIERWGQK